MPKGFNPTESESGVTPNRLKRRTRAKDARKKSKASGRMPSYLRRPTDLSAVPLWSKVLIAGIIFTYCGGMEILDTIYSFSRKGFQCWILIVPVMVLAVAAYWNWQWIDRKSGASSNRWVARRNRNESPFERVHGKWRLKRRGPMAALPAQKTTGQLKERRSSRKYGMDHQDTAMNWPLRTGQLGLSGGTPLQGPQALLVGASIDV